MQYNFEQVKSEYVKEKNENVEKAKLIFEMQEKNSELLQKMRLLKEA